jgi:hypothetical protein
MTALPRRLLCHGPHQSPCPPEMNEERAGAMSDSNRILWTAIKRALMMIVAAIDAYLKEPVAVDDR